MIKFSLLFQITVPGFYTNTCTADRDNIYDIITLHFVQHDGDTMSVIKRDLSKLVQEGRTVVLPGGVIRA